MNNLREISAGMHKLAHGMERVLDEMEESGSDTGHLVFEKSTTGDELFTLVLHSDGSYGLSFPAPANNEEQEEEDEDINDWAEPEA